MSHGTIHLKVRSKKEWEQLREECKVYELTIPAFSTTRKHKSTDPQQPLGTVERWKNGIIKRGHYGNNRENMFLLKVSACWANSKGTIKVILAGKHHSAIFSRAKRADGYVGIEVPYGYGTPAQTDVFENMKVGTWIACPGRFDGTSNDMEISFITNEPTSDNVKEMLDTVWRINKAKHENNDFKWNEIQMIKSFGTVTLREVQLKELLFNRMLRLFKWIRRKEKWDLWNSVKANISLKDDGTKLKVRIKGLDGHTWSFETISRTKLKEEHSVGYRDKSVFDTDYWLPFVYRGPNDSFLQLPTIEKTRYLMMRLLASKNKLRQEKMTFGFDGRTVNLSRKVTVSNVTLNYLEGKMVKSDSLVKKVSEFLISNVPITEKVTKAKGLPAKRRRTVISIEAQTLMDDGLNGSMRDLEGNFPFHLNIVYKSEERKWYIECSGKLFYVKGGYGSLKKVESAVKGSAVLNQDHRDDEFGRSGTRVIRGRLAELVGDKNALWIVINVKKMGALMNAIGSGK